MPATAIRPTSLTSAAPSPGCRHRNCSPRSGRPFSTRRAPPDDRSSPGMTTKPQLSLGWVIVYVDDPGAAAAFYERAFGLTSEFVVPSNEFAQLDTGATKLAFATYTLGEGNFDGGVRRA